MGGYAVFLWPAYAITFGVILWNIIAARRDHASAIADARRRMALNDDGEGV